MKHAENHASKCCCLMSLMRELVAKRLAFSGPIEANETIAEHRSLPQDCQASVCSESSTKIPVASHIVRLHYAAAVTSRISKGVSVIVSPPRLSRAPPMHIARLRLDSASGGRPLLAESGPGSHLIADCRSARMNRPADNPRQLYLNSFDRASLSPRRNSPAIIQPSGRGPCHTDA